MIAINQEKRLNIADNLIVELLRGNIGLNVSVEQEGSASSPERKMFDEKTHTYWFPNKIINKKDYST